MKESFVVLPLPPDPEIHAKATRVMQSMLAKDYYLQAVARRYGDRVKIAWFRRAQPGDAVSDLVTLEAPEPGTRRGGFTSEGDPTVYLAADGPWHNQFKLAQMIAHELGHLYVFVRAETDPEWRMAEAEMESHAEGTERLVSTIHSYA